jgi:hypothetical protein
MIKGLPSIGVIALAAATIAVGLSACKQNSTGGALETATGTPTTQPSKEPTSGTTFEEGLKYVRNNQYTYIWVFSRKDGKPFDKDDGAILHKNAPHVVDWVGTDGGKRYIAGTNFDLEPEAWKLLRTRFVVEDYSGK